MKHRQPGLFGAGERAVRLTKMGGPLAGLKARIDKEAFQWSFQFHAVSGSAFGRPRAGRKAGVGIL